MLEMIEEFEDSCPDFIFSKNNKFFPRFIVVERARQEDAQLEVDGQNMVIKQIRHQFEESSTKYNQHETAKTNSASEVNEKLLSEISELRKLIEGQKRKDL